MIHLPGDVLRRVEAHVVSRYPEEGCGLLLGALVGDAVRVSEVVPLKNAHPEPHRRYTLDPGDILRTEKDSRARGLDIVGVFHSHPDVPPVPSEFDRGTAWPGFVYIIVEVSRGEPLRMRAWRFSEEGDVFQEEEVRSGTPPTGM